MAKKANVLKVELIRSLNGCKKDQIATANSLGLRKIGQTVEQPINDATKGKIAKIAHLVAVTEA